MADISLLCCYDHYDLSCDVPIFIFKSGGYKGGMVSFIFWNLIYSLYVGRKGNVFTAFTEMVVYIATIMIAYQNPQMVVWFSSEKKL